MHVTGEPLSKKGGYRLMAGVRRLHMDVLDVVLIVYPITPVIYC